MTIQDEFSHLPKKQAYYRRTKKRGLYLYYAAKARSKKKNLPFNLTHEDIIIPNRCPILDIEIDLGIEDGSSGRPFKPNSPSIDRIVPEKGYVKGNVRIISMKANKYKNNMTRDIIQKLLDYVDGKL